MALNLPAIRQALADRVKTYVNAGTRQVTTYAYDPGSPVLPCVIVQDSDSEPIEYLETFANGGMTVGKIAYWYDLEVRVSAGGDLITAQSIMDEFRSAGTSMAASISDAINSQTAARTLGGIVEDIACTTVSLTQVFLNPQTSDPDYLSCRFPVLILATRS